MNISRIAKWAAYSMAVILLAFILACGGIGFAYEQKLSGKYCLVACDTLEQMGIDEMPTDGGNSYHGVIGETIFAAGWDDRFIIAKQHPKGNEKITDFYILRVSDGLVSGPWAEAGFVAERKKLDVPKELTFTWTLDSVKSGSEK
jgi:hypothetical protein